MKTISKFIRFAIIPILVFPSLFYTKQIKPDYLKTITPEGSSMVFIPTGTYFIGDKNVKDNSPLREKSFKGFFIDIHPVTNIQYLKFVNKSKYHSKGNFNKEFALKNPTLPVTGITLEDASTFAKNIGKRLPTEWEWEIAARGLKKDFYPYLSDIYKNKRGVFFQMERDGIAPVLSTPPNAIGLYDHIGNVFEWTVSKYEKKYLLGDNTDRLELGVIRGGAWTNIRNDVTYSTRTPFPVRRYLPWLGFRCVKDREK